MATKELSCSVCSAEIPLAGDERKGEEVYCTYCNAPHRLSAAAGEEDCEAEEDY